MKLSFLLNVSAAMIWYKFIILSVINEINLLTVLNGVVRSYATTCQGQQLLIKRALFFYRVITLSLLTPINDFSYVIPTCSKWNDITIKKNTHFGWYQLQFDSFNMVDDTPGIRHQGLVLAVHRNECTLYCSSNPNYLVSLVSPCLSNSWRIVYLMCHMNEHVVDWAIIM